MENILFRSHRTVAILFCLCLLPGSATSETAIGFALLREAGELSLWRVNPRSMIGLGIDLDLHSYNNYSDRTGDRTGNTILVSPSLTVIQIYRSDELAPLSYQRSSARIDRITDDVRKRRTLFAEGEIGIGFIWRPPKKNISLSLQQGVSLLYRGSTDEYSWGATEGAVPEEGSNSTSSSWTAQVKSPRLLVTFSF